MNRLGEYPAIKSESLTVKDEVKIDDVIPKREDSIPPEALKKMQEIEQDRRIKVKLNKKIEAWKSFIDLFTIHGRTIMRRFWMRKILLRPV